MNRKIEDISSEERAQIIYISKQGLAQINRIRLITNLYQIDKETFLEVLQSG